MRIRDFYLIFMPIQGGGTEISMGDRPGGDFAKRSLTYDSDTDIMRIVAAFFVVMIHVSGISSKAGIFYDSIARFSVPVFVIISGYYMLAHRTSGGSIAKKCVRLLLVMAAWSGIYFGYGLYVGSRSYSGVADMLTYILTEPMHLWYMYAAAVLYLFTPLLYVFCENASKKEYLYALMITFIFGSVAATALRFGCFPLLAAIIDKMKVAYMLGFVCLYLFGGYVRKHGVSEARTRAVLYACGVLGAAATFLGTLALSVSSFNADLLLSFFAPNVVAAGAAFFVFIKQLYMRFPLKSETSRAVLHEVAGCTLGIYLLHPLVMAILRDFGVHLFTGMPTCRYIPLMAVLIFFISAVAVLVLRRIPAVRLLF